MFASDSGQFQQEAPLGFRGFVFAAIGPAGSVDANSEQREDTFLRRFSDALVSRDGSKILAVQSVPSPPKSMDGVNEVSLIDRASLAVVTSARWQGDEPAKLGFLADGTPFVFTRQPCRTRMSALESSVTRCAEAALYRIEDGALQRGPKVFQGATSVAFNETGDVAIVSDANGRAHLVGTALGNIVMELPFVSLKKPNAPMAISNDGTHIAWQSPIGIEIFARNGDSGTIVYAGESETNAEQLRFSSDGRSLFANDSHFVRVVGEGASTELPSPNDVVIAMPSGFTKDDQVETFDNALGESETRLEAWKSSRAHFTVYRSEASELDPHADIDDWAQQAIRRYGDGAILTGRGKNKPPPKWHFHSSKTQGGRNVAFESHWSEECEPVDRYYFIAERGRFLYRAELSVSMSRRPNGKTLQSWFEAFFAHPFGAPYLRDEHPAKLPKAEGCH